jgi:triosephosphate isomerase (TIM)
MRKKFVVGNWKMNKTVSESIALASEVVRQLSATPLGCEVALAPTLLAIESLAEVLKNSPIKLAAQNCHFENDGAFTGEVSAKMLKHAGCGYVILGHSERRQYFGETDELVNKKVKKALAEGLNVILCVGETLAQREEEETQKVVVGQVSHCTADLTHDDMQRITIAYEPIWAIGTGQTATPEQAEEVHRLIRFFIASLYSDDLAQDLTIQYGGSVKGANAKELFSMPNIDGGLIGGASLKAEEFVQIVQSF